MTLNQLIVIMCMILFLVTKVRTNFVYLVDSYNYMAIFIEFHNDMLRMWEETLPFYNVEYDADDINEETEKEVGLMRVCITIIVTDVW